MMDLGTKKELQLIDEGNTSEMRHARYTLSRENKKNLL
jgi:hypothetical protein